MVNLPLLDISRKYGSRGSDMIDGFNIVITLEVLLSDSLLFSCMDGTIRDLAALRGTYRLIPETADAVRLIFDILQEASVGKVNILLDEPVSNSGRLKSLICCLDPYCLRYAKACWCLRDSAGRYGFMAIYINTSVIPID